MNGFGFTCWTFLQRMKTFAPLLDKKFKSLNNLNDDDSLQNRVWFMKDDLILIQWYHSDCSIRIERASQLRDAKMTQRGLLHKSLTSADQAERLYIKIFEALIKKQSTIKGKSINLGNIQLFLLRFSEKNFGNAGNRSWGCWVRGRTLSIVLCAPPPPCLRNLNLTVDYRGRCLKKTTKKSDKIKL